jgi:hypothetical protein
VVAGLRHGATTRAQCADYLASVDRRVADEQRSLEQAAERARSSRDQIGLEVAAFEAALPAG